MPQTENLRRAALVTGGAKGIGRAICRALAENGMNIAVNYAGSAAAAEETAAACRALGVQAITLQADVRSPEACQKLVEDTVAAFGRIDVLVNNAGITADKLLLRMTEADFDNVLATNLKGAFFCTKAACRFMMHQRYGRIISVSSVVGLHGNAGQTNYAGSAAAAEETAAACRAFGVQAITLQADVRSPEACQNLVEDTAAAFGRIDVLVNNAGITADKLLMRMTESDFDNVLFTNLKGTFFCTKAASRLMMRQRYGRIINISSVVGLHGNAGQANYAASKAGLIGLTKSVAKEYAARNITANAVAPGFIETDMTAAMPESARAAAAAAIPAGRIGRAEDVAAAVAFLAGEQAGYITGQVLCVDGGMGM